MIPDELKTPFKFLGITIFILIVFMIFDYSKSLDAIKVSSNLFVKVLPSLLLVFVLMIVFNLFIAPESLAKYLGKESGVKAWLIAAFAGIISTGPIYLWFPMLKQLKNHGTREGVIATFLYDRAIKPPLLPLMIYYFGIMFTIILTIVMFFISIVQGYVVEKLVEV